MKKKKNLLAWKENLLARLNFWWPRAEGRRLMRRLIIWTNARLLSIGPFRTYFNENLIKIQQFSLKKMHVKMLSAKWRPSCLGLNVLNYHQMVPPFLTNTLTHSHGNIPPVTIYCLNMSLAPWCHGNYTHNLWSLNHRHWVVGTKGPFWSELCGTHISWAWAVLQICRPNEHPH